MSQIDLKELTKKNQEFIHIATQQFLKDGKTDAEIKAILEEVMLDAGEWQILAGFKKRMPLGPRDRDKVIALRDLLNSGSPVRAR